MWNKTQVQNITILSDNWFQVGADESSRHSYPEARETERSWTVEATYYSALWVLLIHALGSYICYISGMLSVIRCIQSCLQQNPKGIQHFPFQPACHLPKNCMSAQALKFVFFFPREITGSKYDNKTGYFWGFSQLFLSYSMQITIHYIKLTPRALLFPHHFQKLLQHHAITPSSGVTFCAVGFSQCLRLSYCQTKGYI